MTQTANIAITQIINDMKRDLLLHIICNMRHNELTMTDAQKEAQAFIGITSVSTIKELLARLHSLSMTYKEIRAVFIKYADIYYKRLKEEALEVIPVHIQKGEIDQAITILKGVNYYG